MKNKIKVICSKIDQELDKHDTFILYIVVLTVICIFGAFAFLLYITFTTNIYLGIFALIIEFGVLTWFNDYD